MTTVAVSGMFAIKGKALRKFDIDSPLTEEAWGVICRLPDLCGLQMDVSGSSSFPTLALPNLATTNVYFDRDRGWLQVFRETTLGKLTSITIHCRPSPVNDFLETFESAALTISIPTTLSKVRIPHFTFMEAELSLAPFIHS